MKTRLNVIDLGVTGTASPSVNIGGPDITGLNAVDVGITGLESTVMRVLWVQTIQYLFRMFCLYKILSLDCFGLHYVGPDATGQDWENCTA